MVLKYLTKCEFYQDEQSAAVFRDQWNYIDGITGASIYYDESCESTVAALKFADRPPMRIVLCCEAYLLNENGKTIEKVRL